MDNHRPRVVELEALEEDKKEYFGFEKGYINDHEISWWRFFSRERWGSKRTKFESDAISMSVTERESISPTFGEHVLRGKWLHPALGAEDSAITPDGVLPVDGVYGHDNGLFVS